MVAKGNLPSFAGPGDDLEAIGEKWAKAVRSHRRRVGAFGRVAAATIDTDKGSELHLTEETTFKAVRGCPLEAALAWIATQKARRREEGSTGKFQLESEDRAGRVVFARVIEVTIIRRGGIDTPA